MKKHKLRWMFVAVVALVVCYVRFKPDTFFSNIAADVPQSAIVSHRTQWWLNSQSHEITLQLPSATWPPALKRFKSQPRFRDMSAVLLSNYSQFRAGHEAFFPVRPARASAGEFNGRGLDEHDYHCRFLRDDATGQVWFYALCPDD